MVSILFGFGGIQYTSVCNPSVNTKCSRAMEDKLTCI